MANKINQRCVKIGCAAKYTVVSMLDFVSPGPALFTSWIVKFVCFFFLAQGKLLCHVCIQLIGLPFTSRGLLNPLTEVCSGQHLYPTSPG